MTTTTHEEAKTAVLNRYRALNAPTIHDPHSSKGIDNDVALDAVLRSATPFEVEKLSAQLANFETRATQRRDLEAQWAAREISRNSDEPDVMSEIDEQRVQEIKAEAAFRQSDSGRLERLIELNEQILAALQNRG